jgi:hypothetical protein
MQPSTLTGVRIVRLTRLNNSVNGNPRWLVLLDDGTETETQSDAGIGGVIDNSEYRDVPLTVTLSRAGRITHVKTGA